MTIRFTGKRKAILLTVGFINIILLIFLTIYLFHTEDASNLGNYVLQTTGGHVQDTQQTDDTICCLFFNNDTGNCGIITFDRLPLGRCVRRTIAYEGKEKRTVDYFKTSKNGRAFTSFACGSRNLNHYSTCNISINGKSYTKNTEGKPFVFLIDFYSGVDNMSDSQPDIKFLK